MGLVFEKCCFFVDLRVGSLIIGYIGLVGSLILTLLSILGIAASGYVAANAKEQEAQVIGTAALVIMIIFLIVVLFHLIFDIVLLVGLHQHKRGHVKAYIIFASIFLVIGTLSFIASIATGQTAGNIIQSLVTLVLSAYFLLVIRSYYLKMDDPTKRPAIYNTA